MCVCVCVFLPFDLSSTFQKQNLLLLQNLLLTKLPCVGCTKHKEEEEEEEEEDTKHCPWMYLNKNLCLLQATASAAEKTKLGSKNNKQKSNRRQQNNQQQQQNKYPHIP